MEPGRDWPEDELEAVASCPACAERRRAPLYAGLRDRLLATPGRWDLWRCKSCGSAFLDPRPTPASIGRAYGERYMTHARPAVDEMPEGAVATLRRRLLHGYLNARYGYRLADGLRAGRAVLPLVPRARARTEQFIRNLRFVDERPRLLDVGCGNGAFLARMRELGWEVQGIDVDRQALAEARFAGLPVREATISDLEPEPGRFDGITLGHVVEHLHDPLDSLARLRFLLRPGGMLWLGTPNIEAAGHRVFGLSWLALDPPRHLVLFSAAGLARLLNAAGFERVEQRPPPPGARWVFRPSLAIERGRNPLDEEPRLPLRLRIRQAAAELAAIRDPRAAEELDFAAWAPG
jgi:2-polyprenyl-3-methyl-5-hydroxy-6-metoxy-1,4-benzoquinol methylase